MRYQRSGIYSLWLMLHPVRFSGSVLLDKTFFYDWYGSGSSIFRYWICAVSFPASVHAVVHSTIHISSMFTTRADVLFCELTCCTQTIQLIHSLVAECHDCIIKNFLCCITKLAELFLYWFYERLNGKFTNCTQQIGGM